MHNFKVNVDVVKLTIQITFLITYSEYTQVVEVSFTLLYCKGRCTHFNDVPLIFFSFCEISLVWHNETFVFFSSSVLSLLKNSPFTPLH